MRKISIALTTWNRYEFTVNSFAKILDDERVEEVTITDDASTDGSFIKLVRHFEDSPKVKIYRNVTTKDCYFNKREAMINTKGEWVMLIDSDNVFDKSYLDAIYDIPEWDKFTFYLPEFPKPFFDARQWSGLTITKENVAEYVDTNLMTNLNAMNFFINRSEYLKVWDGRVDPITSDSIFFSYTWLINGNKILVTPNLEYDHTIHKYQHEGHYTFNQHRTVDFHADLIKKIKELR